MIRNRFSPFLQTLNLLCLCFLLLQTAHAEDTLKPYILGSTGTGTLADTVATSKKSLADNGFTVVGEYAPYADAHVVIVTHADLQKLAGQSDFGGYGVAQRVSITQVGGQIQVAYTNPLYMYDMYRMQGDISGVAKALDTALGQQQSFGSEDGFSAKELRKYHYMAFMPYFDDHITVAEFDSHSKALQAVEAGLAAGKSGTTAVYKVKVSGKNETLFGVALKEGDGADAAIMDTVDKAPLRHTAHLPYDLLVSGNKVYMLHGKFRIAQSFPDLSMGTFMDISGAPGAIEKAMRRLVDQ